MHSSCAHTFFCFRRLFLTLFRTWDGWLAKVTAHFTSFQSSKFAMCRHFCRSVRLSEWMVFIKRQSVKTTDKNATKVSRRQQRTNNRYQLDLFYAFLFHRYSHSTFLFFLFFARCLAHSTCSKQCVCVSVFVFILQAFCYRKLHFFMHWFDVNEWMSEWICVLNMHQTLFTHWKYCVFLFFFFERTKRTRREREILHFQ